MQIPEALLWGMPAEGISGVYIYCEPGEKKAVYDFFTKKFNEDWDTAVKEVIEEYGEEDDDEAESPLIASEFDEGIYAQLEDLDIPYQDGDYCDTDEGENVLRGTLEALEKEFTGISYEGYIAYRWSDVNGSGVEQYYIKSSNISEEKETFDFVAKALQFFNPNDLETDDEDELKEILAFLYDYKDAIDCDTIFDGILDYAEEQDEDLRETLEEAIADLKAGNKITDDEEENDAHLPDGYMDALNVIVAADEYERALAQKGVLPELRKPGGRNEIITSGEESYPRIVYAAKQGDEKALQILKDLKRINGEADDEADKDDEEE